MKASCEIDFAIRTAHCQGALFQRGKSQMKILEIEWKHYDKEGNTCARCSDTGLVLQKIVAELVQQCRPCGWDIKFKVTKLTEKEISQSNIILLNGKPIEEILGNAVAGESHCPTCSELTGNESTCCRTIKVNGKSYESIPSDLIRQAVCKIMQCC
jgi:hypothetical protein